MKAPTVRAVEAFCFLVIWAVPTNASFPQEHIPNAAAKNKGMTRYLNKETKWVSFGF